LMIDQGTDGLSRGIWMHPMQGLQDSRSLARAVFSPLTFDPVLVESYLCHLGLPPSDYLPCSWARSTWSAKECFHRLSVWLPPPEIARQLLTFMLETWAECPLPTSSLLFVPRVVPAFWWGLSPHLVELAMIYPYLTPLQYQPPLPIPIIVLYLPPHQRSLSSSDRLERPPVAPTAVWHREQAALMRGLPPKPLSA
jgi:hypothetical protein